MSEQKDGQKLESLQAKERTSAEAWEYGDMYDWYEGMDWNPVEKVILERRSVRNYKDKQVPQKLVRRLMEAARFAPTGGNGQGWRFIIVQDRKMIKEMEKYVQLRCKIASFLLDWNGPLGKLARITSQASIRLRPNMLHPVPFGAVRLIGKGKLKLFHNAPTVILILKDKRGIGNPDLDAGICGQNIILAAHSLGLGTCWIGFAEGLNWGVKWRKLLNIEWPYRLVEGITIGYPQGNPDGMVPRDLHEMDWWKDGKKTTVF